MTLKTQILSYASINILNASVPFLLLPILTKYLSPSDYGLLSLIQLLMLASLPIILMNTHALLTIEYSKVSTERFQALLSTIIWIPIVSFIFLELIFFIFNSSIIKYFHIPMEYLYLIPLFVLFQAIPTIVPIVFQAKRDPLNFGKYKITMTLMNITLSLLFILYFAYGWEGRLYGIILSLILFTFIGLIVLYRINLLVFKVELTLLKSALQFGVPLIPHSIAGILLSMSDRVFLVNMLGEDAVGVYSVAFQIASAITIIMTSINQAWAPNLYEKLNRNPTHKEKIKIIKTTYKIMTLMILITLIFLAIIPFLYNIFINNTYYEGKTLSRFIVVAFLFQGFYFMVTNYIFYSKKTKILSYITLTAVFLVWLLSYFLMPIYGVLASAYIILIIWLFQFLVTFYISNHIYSMPWTLK